MKENSAGNAQGRILTLSGTMTRQVLAAIVGIDGQVVRIADLLVSDTILVVEMRMKITEAHSRGQDAYAECACCGKPVYIAFARSPGGNGSSPYFKHYGDAGKECPWTTDRPDDPRSIRAQQYEGRQKSARHDKLTAMIHDALLSDSRVEHLAIEKYHYPKHHKRGRGRFPDVYARLDDGHEFAFEVQLSGTFMTEISERHAYYSKEGVSLVWIFDGQQGDYSKQSFKDVIQDHSLDAFFFDEECLRSSKENGKFQLQRKALRDGKLEDRPACSFDDFNIIPGLLPFVEDGLSKQLVAQARAARSPLIEAYKASGPLRNAYGKFDVNHLLGADIVATCDLENKDPWDLISLSAIILTSARASRFGVFKGTGFINYGSAENSLQASINSWISVSSRFIYAEPLKFALQELEILKHLPASTDNALNRAVEVNPDTQRYGVEWTVLARFFPEVFDNTVKQALRVRRLGGSGDAGL